MNRVTLFSSLVCSALIFGCGDDKNPNNPTVNPTPGSNEEGDEDEDSAEDTGNTTPPATGTTPNPSEPTTAPDDTDPTNASGNTSNPSGDTEPSDTSAEEGNTFILPPDGGVAGECDVFAQDCPTGEKCSAYADDGGGSWNNTKCVPVMENAQQPGDPCVAEGSGVSGIDNCDLGAYCWDTDAEGNGTCVALCKGTIEAGTCDDTEKTCAIYNMGVLNLCLDACDPLAQDCDPSDVCIGNPNGPGFLCVLDASGEEGQQHDPCMYANSCDPGLICLDATAANECDPQASGCCQPFCDLKDMNVDCMGAGQVCNPYYEEGAAPPGFENVGYCAIPM